MTILRPPIYFVMLYYGFFIAIAAVIIYLFFKFLVKKNFGKIITYIGIGIFVVISSILIYDEVKIYQFEIQNEFIPKEIFDFKQTINNEETAIKLMREFLQTNKRNSFKPPIFQSLPDDFFENIIFTKSDNDRYEIINGTMQLKKGVFLYYVKEGSYEFDFDIIRFILTKEGILKRQHLSD